MLPTETCPTAGVLDEPDRLIEKVSKKYLLRELENNHYQTQKRLSSMPHRHIKNDIGAGIDTVMIIPIGQ